MYIPYRRAIVERVLRRHRVHLAHTSGERKLPVHRYTYSNIAMCDIYAKMYDI